MLGDPGELGGLAVGEVFGVLAERVAAALELAGSVAEAERRRSTFQIQRRTTSSAWDAQRQISSIPMRASPSKGSTAALESATTRAAIAPTVRHAMRISATTAVLEVWVTSQAA